MKGEVLNDLRLARAYCSENLIWFAPALYQCRIHLTTAIPVAAIDLHYNIYFNPQAIHEIKRSSSDLKVVMEQLGFLWIHEISHLLRNHSERRKDTNANAKLWNIAADFEINDGLWSGLKMPEAFPGLIPYKFNLPIGKLAEWYYHEVQQNSKTIEQIAIQLTKNGFENWDEGSGVHEDARSWEKAHQQQKLHPIDLEIINRSVAKKMQENKNLIGKLPGSWGQWVDEILASKTDWKKILHHRMSMAIAIGVGLRVDYSFARPSRRASVYHPIITPSFSGDRSGRIAVVVDTSGSMGGALLGQAIGEVCKVLEDFRMPVTVIPCDAAAYEPIILRNASDRFKVQKLKGGGGTNMIIGIKAAIALKPKPDSILVLTDGFTPYPPEPFKVPVIFGIIKRHIRQEAPKPPSPPWPARAIIDIIINRK